MHKRYTIESIKEKALEFNTRGDFFKKAQPYYKAAHRNGWLDQVCGHMQSLRKTDWTDEEVLHIASQCSTIKEFREKHHSAYKVAWRRGLLDQITPNMQRIPPANKKWTLETIREETLKYSSKDEWRSASSGSYIAAHRLGVIKEVSEHMVRPAVWNLKWDFESAYAEIFKYDNRVDFAKGSAGAYDHLMDSGRLQEAYRLADMKRMSGESRPEHELISWLNSHNIECIHKFKEFGLELDIYIPKLKMAIEYCGLYYHTEDNFRAIKGYRSLRTTGHLEKLRMCRNNNTRLYTIYEDEWMTRKDQVKGFLLASLGISERTFYARALSVKEVSKDQASEFLNAYHIQGSTGQTISFGLFNNDELLGTITGSRHHRNSDSASLILSRLCFKSGIKIIGGSSRLLSALKNWAQDRDQFKNIVTWSDNRWSEGNVYAKMGMTLAKEYKPSYDYVRGNKRFSKHSLKKTAEEKLTGLSETELRAAQGYKRIWDCGKKKWTIDL